MRPLADEEAADEEAADEEDAEPPPTPALDEAEALLFPLVEAEEDADPPPPTPALEEADAALPVGVQTPSSHVPPTQGDPSGSLSTRPSHAPVARLQVAAWQASASPQSIATDGVHWPVCATQTPGE
jgi:hypothetical protein